MKDEKREEKLKLLNSKINLKQKEIAGFVHQKDAAQTEPFIEFYIIGLISLAILIISTYLYTIGNYNIFGFIMFISLIFFLLSVICSNLGIEGIGKRKTNESKQRKELSVKTVTFIILTVIIVTVIVGAKGCSASIEKEMREDRDAFEKWIWEGGWME